MFNNVMNKILLFLLLCSVLFFIPSFAKANEDIGLFREKDIPYVVNLEDNNIITKNTLSPVPFIVLDKKVSLRNGKLNDVAPTILSYMDIAIPKEMKNEEIFISIALMEDDNYPPTGLIEKMTDDFICLKNFTSSGLENGFSYIKKEPVCHVMEEDPS